MNCIVLVQEDIWRKYNELYSSSSRRYLEKIQWRKQEELVSILSHRKQQVVFCFYNSYIIFTWIFYNSYIIFTWIFYKVYKKYTLRTKLIGLIFQYQMYIRQKVKEIETLQQTLIFYCISLYCPNKMSQTLDISNYEL